MARILVVDDEPDVVSVVRSLLRQSGHFVSSAFDGQRALKLMQGRGTRPDLALVDLVLPGLSGYALAVRMRLEPRTRSVPVLFVSARTELADLFGGAPNVVGQLRKPFEPRELLEAVGRALRYSTVS